MKPSDKLREFADKQGRFSAANTLSVPISFAILYLLTTDLGVSYLLSNGAAFVVATIINLWMNHLLKVVPFNGPKEYAVVQVKFTGAKAVSFFANEGILYVLTSWVGIWYIYSEVLALACTTLLSFQLLSLAKVIPFSFKDESLKSEELST